MSEIVIYEDGDVALDATVDNETIWLSQKQMELLFNRDRTVISKHIKNIFLEDELEEKVVCANFAHTTQHGAIEGKTQTKEVKHYTLDVIISVGYRVKSKEGTKFRIWANKILKEYLIKGYTLNQKRLQQKGMQEFNQAIAQTTIKQEELACDEAKGLLDVIVSYGRSWSLLEGYDEDSLIVPSYQTEQKLK